MTPRLELEAAIHPQWAATGPPGVEPTLERAQVQRAQIQRAQVAFEEMRAEEVELVEAAARSTGAAFRHARPMRQTEAAKSGRVAIPRTAAARAGKKEPLATGAPDRDGVERAEPKPDERKLLGTRRAEPKLAEPKLVERELAERLWPGAWRDGWGAQKGKRRRVGLSEKGALSPQIGGLDNPLPKRST